MAREKVSRATSKPRSERCAGPRVVEVLASTCGPLDDKPRQPKSSRGGKRVVRSRSKTNEHAEATADYRRWCRMIMEGY